jgi:hypothetical protein
MKPFNFINVDAPIFEFNGVKHYVNENRYTDFCGFQKDIDRAMRRGMTHCFIYTVHNQHNGEMITDIDKTQTDVWIRHTFLKIKEDE